MTEEIPVKIVSKEKKKWLDLKEKVEHSLNLSEMDILVNKEIIKLCDSKLIEFSE